MKTMDREIRFRAWDGKKWLKDFLVSPWSGTVLCADGKMSWKGVHEVEPILMQYTGLKDKNGIEIYEGDIIRSKETDEIFKIGQMTPLSRHLDMLAENIGYYDGKKYNLRSAGGQYHLDDWVSWPEMYEIIGNIYQNPELLAPHSRDSK